MASVKICDGRTVVYQYDTGVSIELCDCRDFTECHFAVNDGIIRRVVEDNICSVPDAALMNAGTLTVYVFSRNDDGGQTQHTFFIHVMARPKPADYIDPPEEADNLDALAQRVAHLISGGIAVETDPTVPAWAKQPSKPTYTAREVGALPADAEINDAEARRGVAENSARIAAVDARVGELSKEIEGNVNPLKGKRFAVLGDSISSVNYTLPVWWQLIAEKYGCEFVNYGVSASRIAVSDANVLSFTERYTAMDDTVDGVVVVGGTNDVWGTPIGAFNSADNTTLNGALNEMLPGLLNKYPGKPVLFFAPIQRGDYIENDYPVTVADLKALDVNTTIGRDRVNLAIMVKCRQYGVPCVDLYTACGINGNDANSVYFRTDDVLHPSALGMRRIAGIVAAELAKHFDFSESQVTYTSGVAGYVKTDGTFSTDTNAWRTDYLALDGVTRIVAQYRLTNSGFALAFYDSNKVLMPNVSVVGVDVNRDNTIDIVPPADAAYCIFSHYASWQGIAGWVTLYSLTR